MHQSVSLCALCTNLSFMPELSQPISIYLYILICFFLSKLYLILSKSYNKKNCTKDFMQKKNVFCCLNRCVQNDELLVELCALIIKCLFLNNLV